MPARTDAARNMTMDLKSLGFSEYEARIYICLLEASPSTAYELAKKSGVPRPNTYTALTALSDRGAAMPVSESPVRYVAKDPRQMFDAIAERTRETCDDLADQLSQIATPSEDDYVWNLNGPAEVLSKVSEMIAAAQTTIWIKAGPEVLRPHIQAITEATGKRGVKLMVILFGDDPDEFRRNENCEIHVHEASGVRMGTADNLFTIIVDHREMLTANETAGIQGAHTLNQAVVKMALSLLRHDYYIAEIFNHFKDEIDAEFGPHLARLRQRSYTNEQLVSFRQRTGTSA